MYLSFFSVTVITLRIILLFLRVKRITLRVSPAFLRIEVNVENCALLLLLG